MNQKYINKILKIRYLHLFILIFYFADSNAQFFDNAQTPLSVKWRQIEVDGFKIIYPAELEVEAQRMGNSLAHIYPQVGANLKRIKTAIPIVLQNRGTQANGFVQLAPKKSQFYTTPPQQFDSQDWLNNLAVHELRHIAQFDRLTGGKTRPFDEAYFAYLGAALPTWFLEGDAVNIETALTHAGRGRQPNWIMPFRTQLLYGKKPSYSKSYLGSNKDITSGYYQLGYAIVSDLRKTYGKGIIDSLIYDINQRPLRPYPFAQSLKKITGKNTRQYYLQTLDSLTKLWQHQDSATKSTDYAPLNQAATFATSYYFPQDLGEGKVLALKQSKAEPSQFVIISPDKSERPLFKIGYQELPFFSYGNNTIVWDEIRQDPRYKQQTYSVICTYNLVTKAKKRLSFKSRLFSPSISADGKKIIAVQIDLSNQSNIVVLDALNGKILQLTPNPGNPILQTPALSFDGKYATWISVAENGKSLTWFNGQKTEVLIGSTSQQLSRPFFIGENIAFNAHFSGIDNLYKINPVTKKTSTLTASKYGAFNGSISKDGKSILFNNFNVKGNQIAKTPIDPQPIPANSFVFLGEAATRQENTNNIFEQIATQQFRSKPYRPLAHLFNFHSLSPDINSSNNPGVILKSNDLLNNLILQTGVTYNTNLRKLEYGADMSFKALYPVVGASYRYRPRLSNYRHNNQIRQANWYENNINLSLNLPLSFNAYNHNYSFLAGVATTYVQRNFNDIDAPFFKNEVLFPMEYRIGFTHQTRTAERDIAPRWAQQINFKYLNQPFDKDLRGYMFAFESYFYFPGLAKNHSFLASFNYQTSTGNTVYGNEINTGFGYPQIRAKTPLQNTLFFMYRLPLAFPDWEIGPIAYIKAIKAGVFAGYENIIKETSFTQPKTFGLELRSNMHLLRYLPLIDLGGRLIFVNKSYNQNPIFELLFNYRF